MGKIVKFCSNCDEGFPEKFGFCPNCSSALQAFEMNPLGAAEPISAAPVPETPAFIEPAGETFQDAPTEEIRADAAEEAVELEIAPAPTQVFEPEVITAAAVDPEPETETVIRKAPKKRAKAAAAVPVAAPIFAQTQPMNADAMPVSFEAEHSKAQSEGGYYLTVMEEKNVGTRVGLLGGTFGFIILALMGAMVYNIFSKDLDIGSIDNDTFLASLLDEVPIDTEEEVKKKDDDDGGGGGGGGREEKEPASKGDYADQTPDPIRPPDVHIPKLDDPALRLPPASTQGIKKFNATQVGFANGGDILSNGTGSGGGLGSGVGTGQGSGRGTGAGSGNGSGFGGGDGNGNGDGTGDGSGPRGVPPVVKMGVTQGIKIISKPRPGYTDSARQANIQGTVILRVTFLGSGQVGSISAVKGLPNGLTEQAIAAARRINFEPAKSNGVGQTVTKQIEYTFSIY